MVDTPLRKAAVLVSCLEETDARRLLERLGAAPAGRVLEAVSVLGRVSRDEREAVMREFLEGRALGEASGGVELDAALARRLSAGDLQDAIDSPPVAAGRANAAPFAFLLETDADVIAPFLAQENPQTVAVVLSFLRRSQAAELLRRFEPALQAQVLKRLAQLDEIDPACIEVVAEELRAWIDRKHDEPTAADRKQDMIREMLAAGRRADRERVIAELLRDWDPAAASHKQKVVQRVGAEAPEVVGKPRASSADAAPPLPPSRPPLEFNDLVHLDDEHLLRTFQAVPREVLTLALAGADEALVQRITQRLPRRDAKRIKRSLRLDGPVRLEDIEAAKRTVAEVAAVVSGQ